MITKIETILFTTNLSKNCVPAFDLAVIMALRFKAKLIMLHVVEEIPNYVESRLQGLLGDRQWESMIQSYENELRQKLIGKRTTNTLIQKALEHYCEQSGMENEGNGKQVREVLIGDGDVAECILDAAQTHACDLILLGDREKSFWTKSARSATKAVLRRAKIPTMIVPVDPREKANLQDLSGWRQ